MQQSPQRRQPVEAFDVAIVGGSIAGSVTAIALQQSGLSTVVLDRSPFPRRKPCGEGLSARGGQLLISLGAGEVLRDAPRLSGYTVWVDGRSYTLSPSGGEGAGFGVSRRALDGSLLQRASCAAEMRIVRVRDLRRVARVFEISTDEATVQAHFVVLACGCSTSLPRCVGLDRATPHNGRSGGSMVLESSHQPRAVQIVRRRDFELFCTPTGQGQLNLALLGSGAQVQMAHTADGRRALIRVVYEQTGIEGNVIEPPMFVGPFGRRKLRCAEDGVYLVGDTAETLDPIGGMGMTHAISCGILAAESIQRAAAGKLTREAAAYEYAVRREAAARPLRMFTNLVLKTLTSQHCAALLAIAQKTPLGRVASSLAASDPEAMRTRFALPVFGMLDPVLRAFAHDRGETERRH